MRSLGALHCTGTSTAGDETRGQTATVLRRTSAPTRSLRVVTSCIYNQITPISRNKTKNDTLDNNNSPRQQPINSRDVHSCKILKLNSCSQVQAQPMTRSNEHSPLATLGIYARREAATSVPPVAMNNRLPPSFETANVQEGRRVSHFDGAQKTKGPLPSCLKRPPNGTLPKIKDKKEEKKNVGLSCLNAFHQGTQVYDSMSCSASSQGHLRVRSHCKYLLLIPVQGTIKPQRAHHLGVYIARQYRTFRHRGQGTNQ